MGPPPPTIDMHAHFYGGLVDDLRRRTARPFVADDGEGRPVLHAMTASTVMSPAYTDPGARLAAMDALGIDTQLLTFPGALGIDVLDPAEVAGPIRAHGERLAALCLGSNGRFVGLGGLPLADIGLAAREARHARLGLGLAGVILPGNLFESIARAEALAPVFAALDDVGGLVMVHPGLAPGESPPPPAPDHGPFRTSVVDLQASIARHALTLVLGGFPERYPNIVFQIVNLGGTLPFVVERLEAVATSRPPGTPFPVERFRALVTDTASLGARAIPLALELFGADNVMFGTDQPIFMPATRSFEALPAPSRDKVAGANARHVLERFGQRVRAQA